jgi:hypothetical protein
LETSEFEWFLGECRMTSHCDIYSEEAMDCTDLPYQPMTELTAQFSLKAASELLSSWLKSPDTLGRSSYINALEARVYRVREFPRKYPHADLNQLFEQHTNKICCVQRGQWFIVICWTADFTFIQDQPCIAPAFRDYITSLGQPNLELHFNRNVRMYFREFPKPGYNSRAIRLKGESIIKLSNVERRWISEEISTLCHIFHGGYERFFKCHGREWDSVVSKQSKERKERARLKQLRKRRDRREQKKQGVGV